MSAIGPATVLLLAAAGGLAAGAASLQVPLRGASLQPIAMASAPAREMAFAHVDQCYAVDGDTLRCGGERIRLIGIDSPEMPGHCRPGRHCVEGDPYAAKAALAGAIGASMSIERFGADHYGRTLALVMGPLGDLSCVQLRSGHAIYREDWDVGGKMMKGCG